MFTTVVPVVAGAVCGNALFRLLGLESLPIPEEWNGFQIKGLLRQLAWVPMAYFFVRLWGWLLGATGLLTSARASRFPFGVRFGG